MSDETNTQREGGQSEPPPASPPASSDRLLRRRRISRRRRIDPPSEPIAAIGKFFRENPAVAGSVLYLQITIIGITYAWSLYRIYDINIFDFAETNDFLLAAFKDPYTFLMSVGALLLFVGWPMWLIHRQQKLFWEYYKREADIDETEADEIAHAQFEERYLARSPQRRRRLLLHLIVGLLYTLLIPFLLANVLPKEQPVQLQYRGASTLEGPSCPTTIGQGSTTAEEQDSTTAEGQDAPTNGRQSTPQQTVSIDTALIGSTDKFAFFYDATKQCSLIVPHTQIVHIETHSEGTPLIFGRS